MPAIETPDVKRGWKAAPFHLKGTDGKTYGLEEVRGQNGLMVMFICNHCPYVQAVIDRIIADMNELAKAGIGSAAIMSNNTQDYPEDSFENMQKIAHAKQFPFPYLLDETQEVAKAYDAVCTPDFFGFNAALELQYRGRLDESWSLAIPSPRRELLMAMKEVAASGKTVAIQNPSLGCSIKWK